jgi:4-diphosphocytidyl-2-C-methyl-D-erythritol kinase
VLNFELDKEIHFDCDEPSLRHDNLVTRAASLLKESTKCDLGARIRLRKSIPWGVGLGGGSSDAAATLLALNELWGLGLPLSELLRLASKLGSDVPFFIRKGTALVERKGEKVTPLPSLPSTSFVLLVPPLPKVQGKTKRMYSNLRVADFTEGRFVKAALSSLRQGKRLEPDVMFNVFETAAFDFFPRLDKYREILKEAGAPRVYLAGSGPCLFSLFAEAKEAGEVFSRLKKQGLECYLAFSLPGQ